MEVKSEKSKKQIFGKVVRTLMDGVAVIEVERTKSHRLYGKRYKVSNKIKANINGKQVAENDMVYISEIRPSSKHTHFEIVKVEDK